MRSLGVTGVWELFVPGVGDGTRYKFEILGARRRVAARRPTRWPRPPRCRRRPPSVVYRVGVRVGRRRVAGRRAPRPTRTTRPMSDLRGAPRLVAAGPVLPRARRRSWSTTSRRPGLHPRRVPAGGRAPVRRLVGLPGHRRTTRRPSRFGDPDDFRYLVDRLHQAGIGVILDWVPGALPEGRVGAGPLRRHAALRARRPARAASSPTGAPTSSTSAAREVRNFLVANALYWLEEFHIDGLRVDAVASMLYLDYSREDGRVGAERATAAARTSRRSSFLQEINATAYKRVPGRRHDRRGVDRVAGRHPADAPRRPRLRLQVEHGLDARHASATSRTTRSTGSTTTTR